MLTASCRQIFPFFFDLRKSRTIHRKLRTDHFSLIHQETLHLLKLRHLPHHILVYIKLPCKSAGVPWDRHGRVNMCTLVFYPSEVWDVDVADYIVDVVGGARSLATLDVSQLLKTADIRFTASYSECCGEVCFHRQYELVPLCIAV
jgi:hypothetical protein